MPLYTSDTPAVTAVPTDYAMAGWSFDPVNLQAGTLQLGSGTLQIVRVKVINSSLISNIMINLTAGGIGLVAGRNFAGLYSDGGALLSATDDQTAAWATSGYKVMPLQSAVPVSPWTWYRVAWFVNAVTVPSMSRGMNTSAAVLNAGMSQATYRYSTGASGLTTALPSNIGTMTSADIAWWVAVS